jgi:hypothetical protein
VTPDEAAEQADLLEAIDRFLEVIDAALPMLTSSCEVAVRQYAAAALVRGCSFVASGTALVRSGHSEGVGLLARSAWESWLVGTFLHFGQEASIIRLQAEQIRQKRTLVDRNGLSSLESTLGGLRADVERMERLRRRAEGEEIRDDEQIEFTRLTIESIAIEVGPLIEAATGEPADVAAAYDMFYRSHSAFDTHGLHAIDRYISAAYNRLELAHPVSWIPAHRSLAISALYLSILAAQVFERFGISVDRLEPVQAELVRMGVQAGSDALDVAASRGLMPYLPPNLQVN